jgi:hypothetical protein
MNQEEVKRLLEKYYAGDTTLDEELLLKKFFINNEVGDDLRNEQEIFRYMVEMSAMPEPSAGFEERILSGLDYRLATPVNRKLFTILSGVAAALLITAGTYFFFIHNNRPQDTYSDPQIAYAETMKILYDVSAKLNKGTRALGKITLIESQTLNSIEKVNRSASLINEQMRPLNKALNAFSTSDTISKPR